MASIFLKPLRPRPRKIEDDPDYRNLQIKSKIERTEEQMSPEVIRARQKLQMHCNHYYSMYTKRCIICDKHKDAHVCD